MAAEVIAFITFVITMTVVMMVMAVRTVHVLVLDFFFSRFAHFGDVQVKA